MKYLFEAYLTDGTILRQTQEDKSLHTPGKNAYYDVLQRQKEVELFGFVSEEDPNLYAVNLLTGKFSISAVEFEHYDPRLPMPRDPLFRLVYFKRHTHSVNTATQEQSHDVAYHFGWQITVDGQNYQSTMRLT